MGLKNQFTKEVGNKVLNIEDIKEKHQLPVNLFEVDERRERGRGQTVRGSGQDALSPWKALLSQCLKVLGVCAFPTWSNGPMRCCMSPKAM